MTSEGMVLLVWEQDRDDISRVSQFCENTKCLFCDLDCCFFVFPRGKLVNSR